MRDGRGGVDRYAWHDVFFQVYPRWLVTYLPTYLPTYIYTYLPECLVQRREEIFSRDMQGHHTAHVDIGSRLMHVEFVGTHDIDLCDTCMYVCFVCTYVCVWERESKSGRLIRTREYLVAHTYIHTYIHLHLPTYLAARNRAHFLW